MHIRRPWIRAVRLPVGAPAVWEEHSPCRRLLFCRPVLVGNGYEE